jgi:hypothetical protein
MLSWCRVIVPREGSLHRVVFIEGIRQAGFGVIFSLPIIVVVSMQMHRFIVDCFVVTS